MLSYFSKLFLKYFLKYFNVFWMICESNTMIYYRPHRSIKSTKNQVLYFYVTTYFSFSCMLDV